jgi:steroid 5-alpha reductase family enzyme
MGIKDNKTTGLIIISIIYIFASIIGIYVYSKLINDYPFYINLLISDTISTFFVFIFSTILSNSSVYDAYWSVQPIVILYFYMIYYKNTNEIFLLFLSILFWGIRLTLNWVYTFSNLTIQDWRYSKIKNKTGIFYPIVNFVGIHYFPTLIVYFCVLPSVYLVFYQNENKLNLFSIIFLIGSFFSTILEAEADREMHVFKKKKDNNTFIRIGLWKYSRHPNYLGEILFWWFIGLYCISIIKDYYFILIGPFLNTMLFIFISIPLADNHQRRKNGFELYYKETRMLLPLKK